MNLKATSASESVETNANIAHLQFGDETSGSCEILYVQIADTCNIAIASTSFANLLDGSKNALLPFLARADADDLESDESFGVCRCKCECSTLSTGG